MKDSRNIAVVGFSGDKDQIFTRQLNSYVSNIQVKDAPYFQVIDHAALTSILQQHFIQPAAIVPNPAVAAVVPDPGEAIAALGKLAATAPGMSKQARKAAKNAAKQAAAAAPTAPEIPVVPSVIAPEYIFQVADAAKLGQLAGADTILSGVVTWPDVAIAKSSEEKTRCAEYEKRSSDRAMTPGIKGSKCVRNEKYVVACTTQTSDIGFSLNAVKVSANTVAFSKDYKGKAEHKFCDDDQNAKALDPMELSNTAIASALSFLRQDLAPYTVEITIQLLDKDESQLASKPQAFQLMNNGLQFAKDGRMDRACENFENAKTEYDQSPALLYNLGVCAEVMNELGLASTLYQKADRLTTKNNKTISMALNRISERIAKDAQLETQLR